MRKLVLGLTAAAAVAVLALPGSAMAGPRLCGDDEHVYGLKTFCGTGCGVAVVVSARLANRFSDSGDFSGGASDIRITQRDGSGDKWKCNWQSADSRNEIINWACKRGSNVILWVWREEPLRT